MNKYTMKMSGERSFSFDAITLSAACGFFKDEVIKTGTENASLFKGKGGFGCKPQYFFESGCFTYAIHD